ncbi:hypothetical protein CAPTEDRAFT_195675 [Capitella teleta]|uniref:Stalled ribosome sensor GCN1-like N-terminal domain-containing protein n=1 Tax=Capitella teleta TaxID=283909 RepID=X1ZVD3_CAPTE|nr:hypothetical protein CAPTEDRAFT_195675 [Capitella teleta]|eukprot:ELT88389.1 hypothetical protein CAPTEDRAFT_195675 [Capitella teleta]
MADPKMSETLKQFQSKVTTTSVNERVLIFTNLHPFLQKPDFPETGIKGIVKLLLLTLWRYEDNRSRQAVDKIFSILATSHRTATAKAIHSVMGDMAANLSKIATSAPNSGAAMSALSWLCTFVRCGYKTVDEMKGDEFKKIVALQSLLVSAAVASERKSISNGAYRRLRRIWVEIPGSVDIYAELCSGLSENPLSFCLLCCILKYLASKKDQDRLSKYKKTFLEAYVKSIIGSRAKIPVHVLKCCNELLKLVTRDDFREQVLPALERAMLRNPEIVLQSFCIMIEGLKIELSPFVMNVGKLLGPQCHSKDDSARDQVATACCHLAALCSEQEAVEKLTKHFFAILNGSEGKLTVVTQRISVLTAIGHLSKHTVSGAAPVQKLSSAVVEMFIPVLQQEVHEGTLLQALAQMSLWCAKFTTEVPDKLMQWFKTGFALKSSTTAVRAAYIQCMDATFSGDCLIKGLDVCPLLNSSIEKASAQSTNHSLVFEALVAASLLAKLSMADIQAESKMAIFWAAVLDRQKQIFINDKFLAQASDEALKRIATLTRRLVTDHPQKMNETDSRGYYKAMVYALTHGNHETRKHVQSEIKKMTAALGGCQISLALIQQFRQILQAEKLLDYENIEDGADVKFIKPSVLSNALLALTSIPHPEPKEAELVAMEVLVDAHHPCIMAHCGDLWVNIVAGLRLDAQDLISKNLDKITSDINKASVVSPEVNLQGLQNTVCTMVRIAPKVLLPNVLDQVYELLKVDGLSNVSQTDVNIMNWPEGDLYDKSVLESAGGSSDTSANMKRESKLYSYAEQLEFLELRKSRGRLFLASAMF